MNTALRYRALKYFGIALIAILLCAAVSAAFQQMDRFIEWQTSWGEAVQVCLLAAAAMFPTAVICASSIALVVIFRNTQRPFLPTLGQSAIAITPLALIIWLYGAHVQPQLTVKGVEIMWNAQMKGTEYAKTYSGFLNSTASTSTRSTLRERIDSLQTQMQFDGGSLRYETGQELAKYRIEQVRRNLNALCFIITSLLFACLGYASRKASVEKIFGIAAIVIVCVYAISQIFALANLATTF